jgi:hypothetical protein
MSLLKPTTLFRTLRALLFPLTLLLALPACNQILGLDPPGEAPPTGLIFCDIRKETRCATDMDIAVGIPIGQEYERGFWQGRTSEIGLDYTPLVVQLCQGKPMAVVFRCPYPTGCPVCLDCQATTGPYPDTSSAQCARYCVDHGWGSEAYCPIISRVSTGGGTCFGNACSTSGAPRPDWVDPRFATPTPSPTPAPFWTDSLNVDVTGAARNGLRKITGAVAIWDAGATSTHRLSSGDGWVEFVATETDKHRMCGLAVGATSTDISYTDITFAAYVDGNGLLSVWRSGAPDPNLVPFPYASGDRIRVEIVNGTMVRYSRNGTPFYVHSAAITYPIRVDAAIRDHDGTVTDVRTSF